VTKVAGEGAQVVTERLGGVGFLLSQVGFASAGRFHGALRDLGLEPRHFAVLRYLAGAEGESQHALGEALDIPASRMVGLIDDLEERGWAERRRSPADRRAHAVHLTPAGRRALDAAMAAGTRHEAMLCADLTPGEREELVSLLQRLAATLGLTAGVHPGLQLGGEADEAPPGGGRPEGCG
jgi:DNA-binding MarR family transcriptional regulator